MKRILVIKLGALGDFVLAMGPFQAIRAHHPEAQITLLTTPAFSALGEACGYFNRVWPHGRPAKSDLAGLWRLFRSLRGGQFERVYDLQTSTRSSLYRNFLPGAEWSGIAAGCSHPHRNPKRDFMHTLDRQAEQLALAGISPVPQADLSWAQADLGGFNLPPAGAYALLVPGGSAHRPAKRWPVEFYGEIAHWLHNQGILPVILGAGAEEIRLADAIEALCPAAVSFVDRTSFIEIIALARGARWAIGNDTGPMHLIAAAGCPALVLFSGESDPALCAPRGQNVRILRRQPLTDLAVSDVTTHLNRL
ncbi:MAG: glycosyltransferase family 9 protein [Pseudomonadota bacterium]